MGIIRINKNDNFVVMDKSSLIDTEISWKAKGLHAYMLSLPDDWTFYDDELVKHSIDGKDGLKSAIKELKKHGYMRRERVRGKDGTFHYETTVVEKPLTENPLTENPLTENPLTENPQLLNNNPLSNNEPNNNREIRSRKSKISDEHIKLANRLFNNILNNNPDHKQPNINSWANDVRLMMERDERTREQIEYVIDWCQQDSFWKSNILSCKKLREKFDQLVMRIKEDNNKQSDQQMPKAYQSMLEWANEEGAE